MDELIWRVDRGRLDARRVPGGREAAGARRIAGQERQRSSRKSWLTRGGGAMVLSLSFSFSVTLAGRGNRTGGDVLPLLALAPPRLLLYP